MRLFFSISLSLCHPSVPRVGVRLELDALVDERLHDDREDDELDEDAQQEEEDADHDEAGAADHPTLVALVLRHSYLAVVLVVVRKVQVLHPGERGGQLDLTTSTCIDFLQSLLANY